MNQLDTSPMLKPSHVAERFCISISTVYKWVKQGLFPNAISINAATKHGVVRIPESDVLALMQQAKAV
jgi:predicted DNA-binding transcriptional regulator AlpA